MPLTHARGWSCDRELRHFRRVYLEEQGLAKEVAFRRFIAMKKPFYTLRRQQIISDREWYVSIDFNEHLRPLDSDQFLGSRLTRDDTGLSSLFMVTRNVGERRFSPRGQRQFHLLHAELGRLFGTALRVQRGSQFDGLSERLRQTLECLLEGDSEKQAALRLGLSRHTVHEYVTDLYRRLGVNSRGELLALCLRRGAAPGPGPQPAGFPRRP
jgi:DNA-binding CsgD family transcriptional regulator